jgi:hypothetical protein
VISPHDFDECDSRGVPSEHGAIGILVHRQTIRARSLSVGLRGRKTLRRGSDVTSVIYLYNTPGYQSKMGIYIGTLASASSSVQPLAAGSFIDAAIQMAFRANTLVDDVSRFELLV